MVAMTGTGTGLLAFELRRGQYRLVAEATRDGAFTPGRPFPGEIVPAALVAGPLATFATGLSLSA
jgi:hypothetical protein